MKKRLKIGLLALFCTSFAWANTEALSEGVFTSSRQDSCAIEITHSITGGFIVVSPVPGADCGNSEATEITSKWTGGVTATWKGKPSCISWVPINLSWPETTAKEFCISFKRNPLYFVPKGIIPENISLSKNSDIVVLALENGLGKGSIRLLRTLFQKYL